MYTLAKKTSKLQNFKTSKLQNFKTSKLQNFLVINFYCPNNNHQFLFINFIIVLRLSNF